MWLGQNQCGRSPKEQKSIVLPSNAVYNVTGSTEDSAIFFPPDFGFLFRKFTKKIQGIFLI
jgi:hypothetical protein